jgi:hypothetical protein
VLALRAFVLRGRTIVAFTPREEKEERRRVNIYFQGSEMSMDSLVLRSVYSHVKELLRKLRVSTGYK